MAPLVMRRNIKQKHKFIRYTHSPLPAEKFVRADVDSLHFSDVARVYDAG